ncbi:MAG: FliI/YscN family ATPase [Polyangiales bacterium]
MTHDLEALRRALDLTPPGPLHVVEGRVTSVLGLGVRAQIPGARVGAMGEVLRRDGAPVPVEIVGFDERGATLLPLGDTVGVGPGDPVRMTGSVASIACGEGMLGRVLDGRGAPLDGRGPLAGETRARPLRAEAPEALRRQRVREPMPTGVRVIDAMLTLAAGQRVGIFAGSGVGKSALLGQVLQGCAADVVVVALVGERGREVREFLDDVLDPAVAPRTVAVVATSDAPALLRLRAAEAATAIAEHFRDEGRAVLLLMDSITRVARALRDVGLAAGEPPVRRALPPSVFAALPRLLERAGPGERGAITAIYTVLVEGGDLDEPVADEVRALLDGHLVLDRDLLARGRVPPVDVLASASRVMDAVTPASQRSAAARVRALLHALETRRELIALGAYTRGSDALTDEALSKRDALEAFLAQPRGERSSWAEAVAALEDLARPR